MVTELSVLIPVYNFNVLPLVNSLLEQCRAHSIKFEICVFDDGSDEKFRKKHSVLNLEPEVRYMEMRQNVGRSAIRNRLAADANYKYLLFLDNDSLLPDNQFIKRYLETPEECDVAIGGTIYQDAPPSDLFTLRWYYGRTREEKPAAVRLKKPYKSLTLNNMLIRRDVYLKHQLTTELTGYGHEDTKFGWELQAAGVKICHLDNPVVHVGLESASEFLKKSKQAARNLYKLYEKEGCLPGNKLVKAYELLRRTGMRQPYITFFWLMKTVILTNLRSTEPSLYYFDLFKLYQFTKAALGKD